MIKIKIKEETGLRDKHFIIIYIHIIVVIIINNNSSNDDTDDGEWVEFETLVDINLFGSVWENESIDICLNSSY